MPKFNRTCVICGTQYKACKNCEDSKKFGTHQWRMSCERVECFQVLLVLTDFYYGKITKQEARNMLSNLLPEVPPPYVPEAQAILDKILEEDAIVEVVQEEVVEAEVITQSQDETLLVDEPSVQPDGESELIEELETPISEEVPQEEESVETVADIQQDEQTRSAIPLL